jgi:FMN-dependent NADH-azoreductase
MTTTSKHILEIASSGRTGDSVSRALSRDLIAAMGDRFGSIKRVQRDLNDALPFVDEDWISANFTPEEARTAEQRKVLALSDQLVEELKQADTLVIGVPIYNFSIPAALKAWIDLTARARLTFRYTAKGPRGLLEGKKAYLIVASGGVPVGSPVDFATPYLRHALAFMGIDDVEIIAAERLNSDADNAMDRARARIAGLIHLLPAAA